MSQVHKPDGNLKDDVVGTSQLQDNSVTSNIIAPGAITKTTVGLANVDNTADPAKPVSTATQTALDSKLSTADLDSQAASKIATNGTAVQVALNAAIEARVIQLGNGTADDTTVIAAALIAGSGATRVVRGKPGQTYTIAAPLAIGSNTTLDMTGCTVAWKSGTTGHNMVRSASATPQRSVADGVINATTTLTSATAAFVAGDVGRTVTVFMGTGATQLAFTANIASVTNGTTVILSKAAPSSASGRTVNIHDRTVKPKVIGGAWDRGNAVGVGGHDLHTLSLTFADGPTIDVESVRSTQVGAKYAIYFAAVTDFYGRVKDMSVVSDGIHITGPATRGEIPYIGGTTGDDMLAITGQDYPDYMVAGGDVTDVHAGTVLPRNSLSCHKIIAGQGCYVDGIKFDYTAGYTSTSHGAYIGDDATYLATTGGTYGTLDLGVLKIAAAGEVLKLVDVTADKIIARVVGTSALGNMVKTTQQSAGGTITALVLNDSKAVAGQTLLAMTGAGNVLRRVEMNRPETAGTALLLNNTTGTIDHLVVTGGRVAYTSTLSPLYGAGGTVTKVSLVDCAIDVSGASGTARPVMIAAGVYRELSVTRGTVTGAGSSGGLLVYNPTAAFVLTLDHARFVTMKRVVSDSAAGLTVYLTNAVIESSLSSFYSSANGMTLIGSIASLVTATRAVDTAAVGTIRVNGASIPVNVSQLTPTEGDQAKNTSAAAADGWYLGPVVWDSTASISKWTPLRGYVAVGTATLVAGAVTVSDTKITTNSQIQLSIHTPMANMGAPFVAGKTASTGFVINSTNAADTSVIRYRIVTY